MILHEYQAKQLITRYDLPIPEGCVCHTLLEAEECASKLKKGPWILKCQVHAGGRGKSGGIKVVTSKEEIHAFVEQWLGQRIVTYQTDTLGLPVNQILIEKAIKIVKELYLGVVIDRSMCRVIFIASSEGGIEIEKVAVERPNMIYKAVLDPLTGPQPYQGRELAFKLGLSNQQISQFSKIFMQLATLFFDYDLAFIEINPLAITNTGSLICLDCKLSCDSNALFRQLELSNMYDESQQDKRETHATKLKFNYVTLDGNIGCMVNGAGLAMGTMDIIKLYGGQAANFLDVSGSATKELITEAFKMILLDDKVKAILVNIFGGIVRCDLIANGMISAISDTGVKVPVVVRFKGNNAELGTNQLLHSGFNIIIATTLSHAVRQVIAIVNGESCLY